MGLLLLGSLEACAVAGGPTHLPVNAGGPEKAAAGWSEVGVASWYGPSFQGRPTASGEIYDTEAATAAHRTLPFGTRLKVENLDNGRTASVTVNDRGPFVKDRILDVSARIARELGMMGPGTARVRITVLEAPVADRCWMVQVGAFSHETNALSLRGSLEEEGFPVQVVPSAGGMYLVQVGAFSDRSQARRLAEDRGGFLVGC